MSVFHSLSAAGFAATAITYGPARMGFGLFVPEFRAAFAMSNATVGFVASLAFFAFFLSLLIAQAQLARWGPEAPVRCGLLTATAGMALVAAAPGLAMLAAGVALAATGAGLAWAPFNNAVHRQVRPADRPRVLSAISTGTGIALAALAALGPLLTGLSWRYSWAGFAIVSALVFVGTREALRSSDRRSGAGPAAGWRALLQKQALPLFAIAFVFGTISAIYISFAADRAREAGGVAPLPAEAAPVLIFVCYGIVGLTGLATGRAKAVLGLPWLLRSLMLAGAVSVILIALAPASWAGLTASAGLQGLYVMMTSAILAFWSEKLFPSLPSLSFTAALLAMAIGSVLGATIAGLAADAFGVAPMFLGAAALPAATALLLRDRHAQEGQLLDDN